MSRVRVLPAIVLAALTVCAGASIHGTASRIPGANLGVEMEWVTLDYDWAGSPWGSRDAAVAAGAFIPENNVATGLSFWRGTYFVCVPRWKPGVPATLTTAVPDPTNASRFVLRPYPNWDYNLNVLNYVQSVWVDETHGHLYVIDTGRMNFFSGDASIIVNTSAKLRVLDLHSNHTSDVRQIYFHEFSDSIFPYTNSFLNDIVVDLERGIAFMSDTNVDPTQGALVAHNMRTGQSRRFVDSSTRADLAYLPVVNNVSYPNVHSPADGIALSRDGRHLFYSAVQGDVMYTLDAHVLANMSLTHDDVKATVRVLFTKPSFSDGLRFVPMRDAGAGGKRFDAVWFGGMSQDALFYIRLAYDPVTGLPSADGAPVAFAQSDVALQWMDSFAEFPNPAHPDGSCPWLAFTTNRLQLFFANTMDWSGASGPNMRLFLAQTC